MKYDIELLRECCKDEAALARVLHHLDISVDNRCPTASEQQLKAEERYRRLVELQTDVICAYTPDTRFTFANQAYCEYFGYTREDIVGKTLLEIVPAEIRDAI